MEINADNVLQPFGYVYHIRSTFANKVFNSSYSPIFKF